MKNGAFKAVFKRLSEVIVSVINCLRGSGPVSSAPESNARQIAEASLRGTKADKVDVFQIDGSRQLCALVTLTEQKTEDLARQILTGSGARLSSTDERVLAEEFKADKGQKELLEAL